MRNKKHILLVAPYLTFPNEPGDNRFITVATMLATRYEVTLVTSKFCHFLKSQRTKEYPLNGVKVVLIDEPGYKKNISVLRFMSHWVFCKNLIKYLENNKEPIDLVYSAYPLIYTNYYLGKHKNKYGYKLVIDIQDIWPDSIMGPISFFSTKLGKLALAPINKYANITYSFADGLIAVSNTYLKKADMELLPNERKAVVYIGGNSLVFNELKNKKHSPPLIVTYIGTMAGSYDLETVIRAAPHLKDKVRFQFIGGGEDEVKLRKINEKLGGHVNFLGSMKYDDAMQVLSNADVAINPIKLHAQQSITNKLSDYFCCGLPIVSCQENEEVKHLLTLGGGCQYKSGNVDSLVNLLSCLSANPQKINEMQKINIKLAEEKFYRPVAYLTIMNLINSILRC